MNKPTKNGKDSLPSLPSTAELATLAALIAGNESIDSEFEEEAKEHTLFAEEEPLTATERLLRKAMHVYLNAADELKAAQTLTPTQIAIRYRSIKLLTAVVEEQERPKWEATATWLYPGRDDDSLRSRL